MSIIRLSVATYITLTDSLPGKFKVRSIFQPTPFGLNTNIEEAEKEFKEALSNLLIEAQGWSAEWQADLIHRIGFSPEIELISKKMTLRVGKMTVEGAFTLLVFEAGRHHFFLLPAFDMFMCVVPPSEYPLRAIQSAAEKAITELLKSKKAEKPNEFDPKFYFSPKREYISRIELWTLVENRSNSYWKNSDNKTDKPWDYDAFNGASEIEKIGKCYNNLYPGSLKRNLFRAPQLQDLLDSLLNTKPTPVALVGPAGVGRHTLFEEVVFRYLEKHFADENQKQPKKFWRIDPQRVIAGMKIIGMWEKRFKSIIDYLTKPQDAYTRPYVLMVDNPLALIFTGRHSGGNMALSDVLRPYLEEARLPFLLIATPEEWSILEEHDRRFGNLFKVIRLEQPTQNELLSIFLHRRATLEQKYDVSFYITALDQLLRIHRNYFSNKALPGSLVQMLEQLAIKNKGGFVTEELVRNEFEKRTGLSSLFTNEYEKLNTEEMEAFLSEHLVGQPEATKAILSIAHLLKSRMMRKNKPISSLLFTGPTGVGKTQAAKALCQLITGSEQTLIRFDMNEYNDWGAVQRLVGNISRPEGQLTSAVRQQPFGVLLLDEIEKAHPKVLDLLLQLLDDARLTDSAGQTTDFSNIIIIMTSNLGAREASTSLGFTPSAEDMEMVFFKAVEQFFRPEMVNRIDHIIAFRPLDEAQILQIARLQIRELLQRDGFVRRTSVLNVEPQALQWVAGRGFDPRMGGRALKRQLEKDLTALSADLLIKIPHDNPVLININLDQERLTPQINTFTVVNPIPSKLPEIPQENGSKAFLEKIRRKIEKVLLEFKEEHRNIQPTHISREDLDYYEVLEKIENFKENLENLLLSFQGNYMPTEIFSTLRLKKGILEESEEQQIEQKIFREDAIETLHSAYQYQPLQFNLTQSALLEIWMKCNLLEYEVKYFNLSGCPEFNIEIRSLVNGEGLAECRYLTEMYCKFLERAGYDYSLNLEESVISAKGYGLMHLLGVENGIHLFKSTFGNKLPIRITISSPQDPVPDIQNFEILRIYHEPKIIQDLRTGYFTDWNISPMESAFFFCAAEPTVTTPS